MYHKCMKMFPLVILFFAAVWSLTAGYVVRYAVTVSLTGSAAGVAGITCDPVVSAITAAVFVAGGVITAGALYVLCLNMGKSSRILDRKMMLMKGQNNIMKDSVCKLQDAYMMTEKTNKAKSKFVNRMSHDLRTPMNAIIGYSTLLERQADDPGKVVHYANRIFLAGQTLLDLINDVLDIGSFESGNVKLVEREFSLKTAFEEICSAIRPQVHARKQNFRFYITNSSEVDLIIGDKQRFCQILRNLLSNAMKYTPEGGSIDLIVNIIEAGNGDIQMLCQVKDTGCGMSGEFVRCLFQPFEREDNEMNTSIPGTGLGMSIAKSLVDLMNGSIAVDSELDEGTLVTVRLPLSPVSVNRNIAGAVLDENGVLKGLRFLAAEDNESNAEILKEVLSAMGAECTVTGDGQAVVEAFEKSEPGQYDIILMDIQMPVMDGYQATAAIRKCSHPQAGEIVIVAMTADAFEEDVQKAFVSGMNAHVAKPLELQTFINTISSIKKH